MVAGVLLGIVLLVAAAVVVLTLVRTRPLPGAVWLLAPGIPMVIAGVAVMVWIWMTGLQPSATRSRWSLLRESRGLYGEVFRGVPRGALLTGGAVAVVFFVSLITASPVVSGLGHPLAPTSHCAYRVNEQGVVTCTNQATYYLAGRDDQRYVASWFALACLVGLGMGASGLVRPGRAD